MEVFLFSLNDFLFVRIYLDCNKGTMHENQSDACDLPITY